MVRFLMLAVILALAIPIPQAHAQVGRVDLSNAWPALVIEQSDLLLQPAFGAKKLGTLVPGEQVIVYSSIGTFHAIARGDRHHGFVSAHAVRPAAVGKAAKRAVQASLEAPAEARIMEIDPAPVRTAVFSNGPRDPGKAQLWGALFSGGGHLYAGETDRGLVLMAGTVFSVGIGTFLTVDSGRERCYRSVCESSTNWKPLYFGLGAGTVLWIVGMIDAANAADRANRRAIERAEGLQLSVLQEPGVDDARIGLRYALNL